MSLITIIVYFFVHHSDVRTSLERNVAKFDDEVGAMSVTNDE